MSAPTATEDHLLRRNRDFNLLWFGQVGSDLGANLSAIAFPLLGNPERESVNANWPFWLLVQVGQALTLISSLSFSPDFSYKNPNLNVWVPFTQVKLSEIV